MTFTKQQPRDGDRVLHCGHVRERQHESSWHWFHFESAPQKFQRPDGSIGSAEWFIVCEPCFIEHGERAVEFMCGDMRWNGNAPVIKETVSS